MPSNTEPVGTISIALCAAAAGLGHYTVVPALLWLKCLAHEEESRLNFIAHTPALTARPPCGSLTS